MFKLWSTIQKDFRMLARDRVGLVFMFAMPILLVIIVTSIQNSTFNLLNKNKISLILCNKDTGTISREFIEGIEKSNMFQLVEISKSENENDISIRLRHDEAFVAMIIPPQFSETINARAKVLTGKALNAFGLEEDASQSAKQDSIPVQMLYQPVLQTSMRESIKGALAGALQLTESRQVLRTLYFSLNETAMPDSLEKEFLENDIHIREVAVSLDDQMGIPNASQHNVPAWTIFAMFFVVISLGASIVREKRSGSFLRLKTLPSNFYIAILSKQITYLLVTLLQAVIIFAIGVFIFPYIGLPQLSLPADFAGLFIVTFFCGLCAISYATCVGIFANTQEQSNGFGAISIVILAAIGGLMVPAFAMPSSFQFIMNLSPMHWCLEAYYALFLEGAKLKDALSNVLSLFLIILALQIISYLGLKYKKLV